MANSTLNDSEITDKELGFNIKLMNSLTGEIHEVEVNSAARAAELIVEYKASKAAIDKALRTLNAHLDNWLGIDDQTELANGMRVKRVHRISKVWRVEELGKYLDEDQLSLVTSVRKTDAKNMLAELIERGHIDPKAIKNLDETADEKPMSPFLEVK